MGARAPISAVDRAILHVSARPHAVRFLGILPVSLASLLDLFDTMQHLALAQNPWDDPPEAFVTDGMPAVRGYFEAIYKGATTVVTRPLKVVIVGKETVGKTRYVGTTCLVLQFPSYANYFLFLIFLLTASISLSARLNALTLR